MGLTSAIYNEDCLSGLRRLPDNTVQCCVTSPPYFGLRDYGTAKWEGGDTACDHSKGTAASKKSTLKNDGRLNPGSNHYEYSIVVPYRDVCGKCGAHRIDAQIGLEESPDAYVAKLVAVFREVRRVLRSDGVLWLNLGDSYGQGKQLLGIPWLVAFALQADGWYLRQDIIWHKPNPMPESVRDRCTKAHEYLFLLSKSQRYYFDADALREPAQSRPFDSSKKSIRRHGTDWHDNAYAPGASGFGHHPKGRNKRSVWTVTPKPYKGAHFATFPEALVEPCILAGSKQGDTVLDPFMGAGTVAVVASRWQRNYLGFELNPAYCQLAQERLNVPQQHSIEELAQCSASRVGIAADCAVPGAIDAGAMGTGERMGYVCAGE